MNIKSILNKYTKLAAVVIPIIIIIFPIIYSVAVYAFSPVEEDNLPFIERPDPKYKSCVKETEYMRFHHWEYLLGVREEVVRYGKRGEVNLNKCRECHTSRENFCNKCHDAVSLAPDCFGCHYYP
jgi:hypothetical protein